MDTPADSGVRVLLTLSANSPTNAKVLFPERRLTLTQSNNTLTVGRASKVSTKGFIAALDNAWFDSPVMSRQHAQFAADMDSKKLEVTDLGSLHGTFLNGEERVSQNDGRELKDGDTLRFGAPIWRGTEQFVPTTVRVGVEFVDDSPCSGTFKVPEGSDDEGSECGQDGGADDTIEESSTRRNSGARDAWARHSGPSAPPVVDLTGPRAGRPRICEVIDLSSPCPSPIHIIDDDEDAEEPTNHMATDEFDTPDDVDAANDLEIGDTIVAHPVDGAAHHIYDPRSRDYDDDMDDLVDDLEDLVDDLADSSAEDEEDDNDADPDGYGSHVGDDFYRDDESHLDYSDEHSDSQLGTSDDSGSDDDIGSSAEDVESDLDLMAHRDLMFDSDGPDPWDDLPPSAQDFDFPEIQPLVTSLSGPAAISQPAIPVKPVSYVEPVTHTEPTPKETLPRAAPSFSIERLLNREKPQSPTPVAPQNPSQVTPQSSSTTFCAPAPNLPRGGPPMTPRPTASTITPPVAVAVARSAQAAAQALGAKTGKTDFFLAREQNKLSVNSHKIGNHWPTLSVHALCNADNEAVDEPGNYNFGPATVPKPVAPAAIMPRLYNPDLVPSVFPLREASPEPVKPAPPAILSLAHTNADVSGRRTHVGIPDIVDNCVEQKGEKQTKRKADDISTSTEEEENWFNKVPLPCLPDVEEQVPEPAVEELPVVAAKAVEVPPVVPCEPERPLKKRRMLRVAERLGYAALGGVTAGAMIMGTLIYTAPTFN